MRARLAVKAPVVDGLGEAGLKVARWWFGRSLARRYDIHQHGSEHVPPTGPVVLASNHTGWLDGPLLVACAPRPPHALVNASVWQGREGRLLRASGQIKVEPDGRAAAVRPALRALGAGQVVAMFPEGRRGAGDFAEILPGVTWLALASGAPVVPVAVFGTRGAGDDIESRPSEGARLDLVFGAPIGFGEQSWPRSGDKLSAAHLRVHEHLRAHLALSLEQSGRELPGPIVGAIND